MSRRAALVCALAATLVAPERADAAPGDPVASINLNPFRQMLLASPVRGTDQPEAGAVEARLRTSYAGYFAKKSDGELELFIDNELLRLDLEAEFGLTERVVVRMALPFMAYTRGFLDPVAEVIDDAVNTPSEDREAAGSNRYRFRVAETGDGGRAFDVPEGRFGPGDLLLETRVRLVDEADGWPSVALWGALELPTGSADAARGNGDLDVGLGVIAARDVGPVRLAGGLGVTFPGTPDPLEPLGIEAHPALEGHFGVGWSPCEAWDLLAELDYGQNPFDGSGLAPFARDALEVGVGLRWRGEAVDVDFLFVEDLIAGSSTDFTLVLGLATRFDTSWGGL